MRFDAFAVRALLLATTAFAPAALHAQTTAAPPEVQDQVDSDGDNYEDAEDLSSGNRIVVTATKREQTLQETPISVSVTTAETLERAQIRDLIDLQTVAPSLRVQQLQSSSNTTFSIRGFGNGDNNFGIEPSVGVFIDGVFRSRSAGALDDLANVQRIEVLRGPQSTLFGKNASAGVVSVVTREPQFTFGGNIEASYGNYDSVVVRGDVTGPISDAIAFSLAGGYNRRDGYARIVNLDEDLGTRNRWNVRGQLLIEPTPDLSIRLIGDYSNIDEACCVVGNVLAGPTAPLIFAVGGAIDPNNLFSYDTYLNQVPINKVDNYGGSAQVEWNVGDLTLTSITAYRELQNFFDQDVDFSSADVVSETRDQAVNTFTQELRLASDFDGPLNFLLGGFYFNEDIEQASGLRNGDDARAFFDLLAGQGRPGTLAGLEAGLGLPTGSIFRAGPTTVENYSMSNESYSIFGTLDFEPIDGLVFTVGANYTDDRKDFALSGDALDPLANINLADAFITQATGGLVRTRAQFQALPAANQAVLRTLATRPCAAGAPAGTCNPLLGLAALQFLPPFLDVPNAVEDGQTRDDNVSYVARVAYDVAPELNVYASYSTGFKASSVNLSRDSRPLFGDFVPAALPAGVGAVVGGSNFLAPSSPVLDAGLPITNLTTGSRFAGPEDAEVYEIGIKGQFDGLGFNLALFDQTIKGFQAFLFTGTGFQLANAGQQSAKGFEFDATISPVRNLVFTYAMTYLDSVYDSFVNSPVGDVSGERPGNVPEFVIATSATYTHEFGASGNSLITRLDYNHESNTQILNGVPGFGSNAVGRQVARNYSREVNLVNGSMTFAMDNGLEIGAYVRNLLNDEYIVTIFPSTAQSGSISGYPNQPRTYGGVVRFKF
ncbi:TonB-dependent receptor [Qipengyuania sp.]|uniref:TonB-dependent receptor n=1 Tax=Qipengyuania sp. TaxID=2004515 RepID=UPI0035C7C9DA